MPGLQIRTTQMTQPEYEALVKSVPNGFWWWGRRRNHNGNPTRRMRGKPRLVEHLLVYGSNRELEATGKLLARHGNTFDAVLAEIAGQRRKRNEMAWEGTR